MSEGAGQGKIYFSFICNYPSFCSRSILEDSESVNLHPGMGIHNYTSYFTIDRCSDLDYHQSLINIFFRDMGNFHHKPRHQQITNIADWIASSMQREKTKRHITQSFGGNNDSDPSSAPEVRKKSDHAKRNKDASKDSQRFDPFLKRSLIARSDYQAK